MFTNALTRNTGLLFLAAVSIHAARADSSFEKTIPARRWLNEHVIALADDGHALEPYDYVSGGTPIKFGIIHYHQGKLTHLQIFRNDPDGSRSLKDTGLELSPEAAAAGPHAMIFRDVVIPHMLSAAAASGHRIVLFIHGGMNNRDDAIKKAWLFGHQMEKEGVYPIFVCWESSMGSAYVEHLFSVRNGVNISGDQPLWRWITAPVYLATDVATSVVRAPRIILDMGHATFRALDDKQYGVVQDAEARYIADRLAANSDLSHDEKVEVDKFNTAINESRKTPVDIRKIAESQQDAWRRLKEVKPKWRPLAASKGYDDRQWWDTAERSTIFLAMLPPKLVVLMGFAGAGGEMWDVMSRRTQVAYNDEHSTRPDIGSDEDFHPDRQHYSEADLDVAESDSPGIGAMSVFFRVLEKRQALCGDCTNVVLVGHSMGEMMLNEGLLEFPHVKCREIVYMAGAGSIHDFAAGTLAYLDRNPHTALYSLSLHPRAEDRERSLGEDDWRQIAVSELLPRGSLLVWIDEFLGHPQSFSDRTMGHFENAILASRIIPPRLEKQVHLTALSVGLTPEQYRLQHHGDFDQYSFWTPCFYQDDGTVSREGLYLGSREKQKEMTAAYGDPVHPVEEAPEKGPLRGIPST